MIDDIDDAQQRTLYYPNEDEIFEFFEKFAKLENALNNFKHDGILLMTVKRSEVARYASRIIYGFDDFEEMKSIVETKNVHSKISGFNILTEKPLADLRKAITIGEVVNDRTGLIVDSTRADGEDAFTVKFRYVHKTPGKMNLIDKEKRSGEFRVEKGPDGEDKVVMFNVTTNEDYAMVKQLLEGMSGKAPGELDISEMSLDNFDIKTRVAFIDRILLNKYGDWTLDEVLTLKVKKPNEDTIADLAEEDQELLRGINDAVLEGSNLRDNSFVKKCQKAGYWFQSVVMRLRNDSEATKVDLGVYFKLRPEMPEIVIEETYHVQGHHHQKFKMGITEKNYLLSIFLHDIMEIYKEFVDKSTKKSKSGNSKK